MRQPFESQLPFGPLPLSNPRQVVWRRPSGARAKLSFSAGLPSGDVLTLGRDRPLRTGARKVLQDYHPASMDAGSPTCSFGIPNGRNVTIRTAEEGACWVLGVRLRCVRTLCLLLFLVISMFRRACKRNVRMALNQPKTSETDHVDPPNWRTGFPLGVTF